MSRVTHKLRDQNGVSILLALFLFLVCAVVASVVLVSGTAAAGRFSELTKMDQRYFSVQSAAEMICSDFPTSTEVVRTSMNSGADVSAVSAPDSSKSLANILTNKICFGTFTPDTSHLSLIRWNNVYPSNSENITLNIDVNGHSDYKACAKVRFKSDGTVLIDVYNDNGDDKYHVQVNLYGDLNDDIKVIPHYDIDGSIKDTTTIKTTTIDWSIASVTNLGEV